MENLLYLYILKLLQQHHNMISSTILQVVILTKNEEANLHRVLQQLIQIEKVIILDSYSTDSTIDIAKSYSNVEIYQRDFDTHATQWNYGLDLCNSQWVLSLDADYVLSNEFLAEISDKIIQTEFAAFNSQFRFLIFGKPLRGNNTLPRPVLFQRALCRYYDDGHTQRLKVNGQIENFSSKINHDDRKSLSRWLSNQANYSIKEVKMLLLTSNDNLSFISKIRKTKIFAPIFIFFYCLFVKGLILDGWAGWYYTMQRTIVEMLFALRLIEETKFRRNNTNKAS